MKNFFFLCICALIFASCTQQNTDVPTNYEYFSDLEFGYSFKVSIQDAKNKAEDGRITATGEKSTHSLWKGNSTEENTVDIFHLLDTNCSPSLTGVLKPTYIVPKEHWGEVTGFNSQSDPETPSAFCMPEYLFINNEGRKKDAEAYGFCSKKDSKTVVICINQAKDDPEMAKQIFKSFRWTE